MPSAPLVAEARRRYLIGEPIRTRVDPLSWDVHWPGSPGELLSVRFGRALDRALVRRCLRVVDPDGHDVPGRAELNEDSTCWTFLPASGLARHLLVHPKLEDLAGNSVRRVFDRDLREPDDGLVDLSPVILSAPG